MTAVAALIVAAGEGARFGGEMPKQYQGLRGEPCLARAIRPFSRHPAISEIACVIAPGRRGLFMESVGEDVVDLLVDGGKERHESVRLGLEALASRTPRPTHVLIHDAARPLTPKSVIDAILAALENADGAAPALGVPDTVSAATDDGFGDDLDRTSLLRRQTPQGFAFDAILAAHQADAKPPATDDIAIARAAGIRTISVPGSIFLHKLTTQDDKHMLEALIAEETRTCVGSGFDVHRFGEGDKVWLCGVEIPFDRALAGHSDADVALHALTDAILGAIGAGDIGQHFPPSDPQWRGAASKIFLEHAALEVAKRGGRIENVDVTIICEAPKVGPHREPMRAKLAELLALPNERINVKATTTERLGFTGREEGVAAMATVSVRLPA